MTVRSSSPRAPPSPAWGLRPQTADARALEAHPGQGAGQHFDGFDDGVGRQGVRDFPQGQVARGEDDADFFAEEHHGVAAGAGQAREQFGVAGFADAGAVEGFLADGRGDDGVEAAVSAPRPRGQDVGVGRAGRVGADLAGAVGGRRRHVGIPRGAARQRSGEVGDLGRSAPPRRAAARSQTSRWPIRTRRRFAGWGCRAARRATSGPMPLGSPAVRPMASVFTGASFEEIVVEELHVVLGAERIDPGLVQPLEFGGAQLLLEFGGDFVERAHAGGLAFDELDEVDRAADLQRFRHVARRQRGDGGAQGFLERGDVEEFAVAWSVASASAAKA
jgi:hypothetical protein